MLRFLMIDQNIVKETRELILERFYFAHENGAASYTPGSILTQMPQNLQRKVVNMIHSRLGGLLTHVLVKKINNEFPDTVNLLATMFRTFKFELGDKMCEEKTQFEYIYFVMKGVCALTYYKSDTKKKAFVITKNMCFGQSTLAIPDTMAYKTNCTLTASEVVIVYAFHRDDILGLERVCPRMMHRLVELLNPLEFMMERFNVYKRGPKKDHRTRTWCPVTDAQNDPDILAHYHRVCEGEDQMTYLNGQASNNEVKLWRTRLDCNLVPFVPDAKSQTMVSHANKGLVGMIQDTRSLQPRSYWGME